ncbi:DUF484 family protein [Aerophototrophica crusticola]|uniref:DUF484 family protein n=1 Tax=Aerophototrophica crusticola TaxID=1709002 RepID=A0A858R9B6_9PROT|nr:DUF484 family protein [Rhodospirillaceae bacterium B3]
MFRDPGPPANILASPAPEDALTAEDVAAYLRDNPDFLVQRPDVIPYLVPPSADLGDGVADMQYFMVQRLRGELARMADQQRELVATSRANLNNQNRVHAAALFLLDATSFTHLVQTITTDLAVLLDLDVAALGVEGVTGEVTHVNPSGVRVLEPGFVNGLLGRRDVGLRANIQGLPEIYGQGAGLVRSEALVRLDLGPEAPVGLLAFGSREPDMFHPGQATELLAFLAHVVERSIRRWLDLPG